MAKTMKLKVPHTEEYRELREVMEEAGKLGVFNMHVDDAGNVSFSAGNKSAFVGRDDPMNMQLRREWWGLTEQ